MSETLRIMLNDHLTDIADLKVAQLKVELKKRGISTSGNKQELYEKLKNFLIKQQQNEETVVNPSENSILNNTKNEQETVLSPKNGCVLSETINESSQNIQNSDLNDTPANNDILNEKISPELMDQNNKPSILTPDESKENENITDNVELQEKQIPDKHEIQEELKSDKNSIEILNKPEASAEASSVQNNLEIKDLPIENETINQDIESNDLKVSECLNNIPNKEENSSRETSTERSESCIKEVPMSGDRNRFSRSKSPKTRWHGDNKINENNIDSENINETETPSDNITDVSDIINTPTLNAEIIPEDPIKQDEILKTNGSSDTVITENEIPKVQRKRKWLSNDSTNILSSKKQLTISSETLKNYLPTPIEVSAKKEEELKSDELVEAVSQKNLKLTNNDIENISTDNNKTTIRQTTRFVILEENTNSTPVDTLNNSTNNEANAKNLNGIRKTISNLNKTSNIVDGEHIKYENKIEQNKPISNVLHISNLTRPFTLMQFKELLSKFGSLKKVERSNSNKADDYFWINSVKSHCYVAFEDENSARLALEGLHNTTWPQSNPKQLQVEYSQMEDLISYMKEDKLLVTNSSTENSFPITNQINSIQSIQKEPVLNNNEIEKTKIERINRDKSQKENNHNEFESNQKSNSHNLREWDLPKFAVSSDSHNEAKKSKSKRIEESNDKTEPIKKRKTEEPKTLDDLFKKTASLPHIYWLPLTEQQFIERQKETERRMLERQKRAEQRLLKESEINNSKKIEETVEEQKSRDSKLEKKNENSLEEKKNPSNSSLQSKYKEKDSSLRREEKYSREQDKNRTSSYKSEQSRDKNSHRSSSVEAKSINSSRSSSAASSKSRRSTSQNNKNYYNKNKKLV